MNDIAPEPSLRSIIESHAQILGCSLNDLSVMSDVRDPFRIDTPASHRDAAWLAEAWRASGARKGLHLRGLHYALVSVDPPVRMPHNGESYQNTVRCWDWLERIAVVARWLRYVGWDDIVDERNDEPLVANYANDGEPIVSFDPSTYGGSSLTNRMLGMHDFLMPRASTEGFYVAQPYRLVVIGEKSSLRHVLRPIAERHGAELILPSGNLSNTLLYDMVKRAATDRRPTRVFYFADFDPGGWSMPKEVARKIQALNHSDFPDLNLQLRRTALKVEQVAELGLPSTPMKESEQRADKWRHRWGQEQTEIDALATLRPDVFRRLATNAIAPYYDYSLSRRVEVAEIQAREAAKKVIDRERDARRGQIDETNLAVAELNERVAAFELQMEPEHTAISRKGTALLEEIRLAAVNAQAAPELPKAQCEGDTDEPLFDTEEDWPTQTNKLMADKL